MRCRPWTRWSFPCRSVIAIAAALTLLLGLSAPPATAATPTHPTVYWGAKTGPVDIKSTKWQTVAKLPLPKGRYSVHATATLFGRPAPPHDGQLVSCRLLLGSERDQLDTMAKRAGYDDSHVPVLLTVAGRLTSSGYAKLRCRKLDTQDAVAIRDIRITAIKAGKITLQDGFGAGAKRMTLGSGRPRIISARGDHAHSVTGDGMYHVVGSLDLLPGRWWITAKGVAHAAGTPGSYVIGRCRLVAGADHDDLQYGINTPVAPYEDDSSRTPLGLQVVHRFGSAGKAVLECRGARTHIMEHVVITAVKVGKLTNIPFDGTGSHTYGLGSPRVISGWANGPAKIKVSPAYATVRKLSLPKGRWVVLAKLWHDADWDLYAPSTGRTYCRLRFGTTSSPTSVRYTDVHTFATAPLLLSLNHNATSSQQVKLQCRRSASADRDTAHYIKITAMKAGKLVKRPL